MSDSNFSEISTIKNENILGESPVWNYDLNKFFWVDIEDNIIKSYDDKSIIEYQIDTPTSIGLHEGNKLVISVADGVGIYDLRCNSFNYIDSISDSKVRFNDGKCDRNGNYYVGTMCKRKPREPIGNIYRLKNSKLDLVIRNMSTSNGISFSVDNRFMFYSDTPRKTIYKLNLSTNKFDLTFTDYGPDGSTVDNNNRYYSCMWGGSAINVYDTNQYDENNEMYLETKIDLPVKMPTCCAFGGNDMNRLFITSATDGGGGLGHIMIINTNKVGIRESKVII